MFSMLEQDELEKITNYKQGSYLFKWGNYYKRK